MLQWLQRLFGIKPSHNATGHAIDLSTQQPRPHLIGKMEDVSRMAHLVGEDNPRRSLFEYHAIRDEEKKQWDQPEFRQRAADSSRSETFFRDQIQQLEKTYSSDEMQEFLSVRVTRGDQAAETLCRTYRDADDFSRQQIRSMIDQNVAWSLLTYSKRSAAVAARSKSRNMIALALTAHAIENLAFGDVRDNLVALGLIYHCARIIEPNPSQLFLDIAATGGAAGRALMTDFVRRPDLDCILSAMGWEEVATPDGIGFRWKV